MPLMPPVTVLDAASRKRSKEAAVFSVPARCRPLTRSTVAGVCYESICLSSRTRNIGIKRMVFLGENGATTYHVSTLDHQDWMRVGVAMTRAALDSPLLHRC